ncbi:MAG: choice-of-anchor B family protein [Mycobacteriales bacterium]
MTRNARNRRPSVVVGLALTLLGALVVAPGAAAHPGLHPGDEDPAPGIGVQINSPADLAGFLPGFQYAGTPEVADETAPLVYAGTGCTPASYAAVADQVRGKIALTERLQSQTNPADVCPAATFAQRVASAEAAGAIGLVVIPAEGREPTTNGTAITGGIPAMEVFRSPEILAARDAVIAGTTVEVTLTDTREPLAAMTDVACEDGRAGPFECKGIDLLAFVPQEEFSGAGISDLWGWSDPEGGGEYVIIGKTNGVAFFDVTEPTAPRYLGELPNPAVAQQIWHDIKVYDNHAFIVSESEPHGMTVFDLTRLRDVEQPGQVFERDAIYRLNWAAHNLEINTETGFAYIVGGNAGIVAPDQCLSGLHMVDIREPKNPSFAGCYLAEGGPGTAARSVGSPATELSPAAYVHDTTCVVYKGPDQDYAGREVCFNSAEDKVVIADVSDKAAPVTLGTTAYKNVAYAHQGSLTEDHRFLLLNDELDEQTFDTNTRTIVLDVSDLDAPKVHFEHMHATKSIDHNNYVHGGFVYQSNYTAGLRVLDVADVERASMSEVAFFDTYPAHTDATFDGTWSNYPFFASGTIAVSGIDEGLFLLRRQDVGVGVGVSCETCPVEIRAGESGTARVTVHNTGRDDDIYTVTADDVPDGWTVQAGSVAVAAGDTEQLAVTIDVPRRARAGTYTLTLTATSAADPGVRDSVQIPVEVRKGRPTGTARTGG